MIKTLAKSIRQYKRESILAPILVTCEVTLECLIPLYMITLLDGIEADPSIGNLLTYGAILLVLAAFSLMFGMLAGKYAATASAGFARNLRHDIYYNGLLYTSYADDDMQGVKIGGGRSTKKTKTRA